MQSRCNKACHCSWRADRSVKIRGLERDNRAYQQICFQRIVADVPLMCSSANHSCTPFKRHKWYVTQLSLPLVNMHWLRDLCSIKDVLIGESLLEVRGHHAPSTTTELIPFSAGSMSLSGREHLRTHVGVSRTLGWENSCAYPSQENGIILPEISLHDTGFDVHARRYQQRG